ncbi:MAG: filamentous hemagglutinin family protein [Gammaproteobacteria bacterium]|nr:filamentous hemagglutinin family protein [Gammaproteobacteria bacterium]
MAAAVAIALAMPGQQAAAELPVPCDPCTLNDVAVRWANTASQAAPQISADGHEMTIEQVLDRQIYNWRTFNIGAEDSVVFHQPSSTSVALNRVLDPAQRVSEIAGNLQANGQVYLINPNGVVFKGDARVDVNSLLASSLALNDEVDGLFEEAGLFGVLAQQIASQNIAALVADGAAEPGDIIVEPGVVIDAGENGRIILVGGNIENAGALHVSGPGGQALLIAAEDRVYFFQDDNLRGIGVEVGTGGAARNLGQIIAGTGNVTMAGLTVNQSGIVRATTTVSANGTIRLQARDGAFPNRSIASPGALQLAIDREEIASRSGTVAFGEASVTEVLPDLASTEKTVDDQPSLVSRVEVRGESITVGDDAVIRVPGGEVEMLAAETPGNLRSSLATVASGTIVVGANATIDVAGSQGVAIAADRSLQQLQVRKNELAGSPVNRDGPLFGATITFDIRNPPEVVDVSGVLSSLGRTVGERLSPGGTVTLLAGAQVTVETGAVIDISGGSINYSPAAGTTTKVIVDGQVMDIADVPADATIERVLAADNATDPKWGFDLNFAVPGAAALYRPGYVEGKDAGQLVVGSLDSQRPVTIFNPDDLIVDVNLAGTVAARTIVGEFQRGQSGAIGGFQRPADELPGLGTVVVAAYSGDAQLRNGALSIDGDIIKLPDLVNLELDVTSFVIPAGVMIEMPDALLDVRAETDISIAGTISGANATLAFAAGTGFVLASGAEIDLQGQWVNDLAFVNPGATDAPLLIDGGSVEISALTVTLAAGSLIDVGGGGQLTDSGRLVAGDGGDISIADRSALDAPLGLVLAGDLGGFVLPDGGVDSSLSITTRDIVLAGTSAIAADDETLALGSSFFTANGFTDIALVSHLALSVEDNFNLLFVPHYRVPEAASLSAIAGYRTASYHSVPSGTDIDDFTRTGSILEPDRRTAPTLTLSAVPPFSVLERRGLADVDLEPVLAVADGARIVLDFGGAIELQATGNITVGGRLQAPGGAIAIQLDAAGATSDFLGYQPERAVRLLDSAALNVAGYVIPLQADDFGRTTEVFSAPGGSIDIITGKPATNDGAYVIAAPGALIDVSGATGTVSRYSASGRGVPVLDDIPLATDAGSVTIRASQGIQFFSRARASADQSLGARPGSLTLAIDANLRAADRADSGGVRFPQVPMRIELAGDAEFPLADAGLAVPDEYFGLGSFSLENYLAAGFGELVLRVTANEAQLNPRSNQVPLMLATIDLVGDFQFDAGRSLVLDTPMIRSDGGAAAISADYVRMGYSDDLPNHLGSSLTALGYTPAGGEGAAVLSGDFIDVTGLLTLRGFGTGESGGGFALLSATDLRLTGQRAPILTNTSSFLRDLTGVIRASGDLVLGGERIYPSTLTDFRIENEADAGAVIMMRQGESTVAEDWNLTGALGDLLSAYLNGSAASQMSTSPLSAGGSVTVSSDNILNYTGVYAPVGQIILDADAQLILADGSLLSTTSSNTTLFGEIEVGEWVFPFRNDGNLTIPYTLVVDPASTAAYALGLPEQQVRLIADGTIVDSQSSATLPAGSVEFREGATIDVTGGGELVASEFIAGPSGKTDILAASAQSGAFALIPVLGDTLAPVDPLDTPFFEYAANQQIRIVNGGDSGIAPGVYAVLPPRYALLPGAYLLTPDDAAGNGVADPQLALYSAEGLPVVTATFQLFGQTSNNSVTDFRFKVEDRDALGLRGEYALASATEYFTAKALDDGTDIPLLPGDAGALQFLPNRNLILGGSLATSDSASGLGARVDIVAERITLVTDADESATDGLQLVAAGLESLGAESLLLGGTRRAVGNRIIIDDVATTKILVNDDVAVELPSVTLVASESILLGTGSVLKTGTQSVASAAVPLELVGDAAILRISTRSLPAFSRSVTNGGSADVVIEEGASLFGVGSVLIDATGDATLTGSIALGAGGGLALGIPAIGIGVDDAEFSGTRLSDAFFTETSLGELVLRSSAPIALLGTFDLSAGKLTVDAPGLRGYGAQTDTATLRSNRIALENQRGSALDDAEGGSGRLVMAGLESSPTAGELVLGTTGGAEFFLAGFSDTQIDVGSVVATDDHALQIAGDAAIATTQLLALAGKSLSMIASGQLSLVSPTPGATPATTVLDDVAVDAYTTLASSIALRADDLLIDAPITARSGTVTITARDGHLMLDGSIDVSGLDQEAFGDSVVSSPGGRITLVSNNQLTDEELILLRAPASELTDAAIISLAAVQGGIVLGANADLDVSGGSGQSGGSLTIAAPDSFISVATDSALVGNTFSGVAGAEFVVDVGYEFSDNIDVLFSKANIAPGTSFAGRQQLRFGDAVDYFWGIDITARDIGFDFDEGSLAINSMLDASGGNAGTITLNARDRLTLSTDARLLANATDGYANDDSSLWLDGRRGGKVTLASPYGEVGIEDGAIIDVAGTRVGASGDLEAGDASGLVRLIAQADDDGISLNVGDVAITGAHTVEVIGHRVYTPESAAGILVDGRQLTNAAQTLREQVGLAGVADVRVAPGVEIVITDSVTVDSALFNGDLAALFDAVSENPGDAVSPGMLTIRAAGDLVIAEDVVDGLISDTTPGFISHPVAVDFGFVTPVEYLIADEAPSWSVQFIAGADLSAVNPLTVHSGTGDLTISDGVSVVTGTGDIAIVAGGDINLGIDARVFTAGRHQDLATNTGSISDANDIELLGFEFLDFETFEEIILSARLSAAELVIPGASFPDQGGDVAILAGGDFNGAGSSQFMTQWMVRTGVVSGALVTGVDGRQARQVMPRASGVVYDVVDGDLDTGFNQGVAAFGGGNLTLVAGGDIKDVSLSLPTTLRQEGTTPLQGNCVEGCEPGTEVRWLDYLDDATDYVDVVNEIGGGVLRVQAGGSINELNVLVTRGDIDIRAAHDVALGTLGISNTVTTIVAGGGALLGSVADLMSLQSLAEVDVLVPGFNELETKYFGITADAALALSALSGDVVLTNEVRGLSPAGMENVYPGNTVLTSLAADVQLYNSMILFPDATGTLLIGAGQNIRSTTGNAIDRVQILQSDYDRSLLPGIDNPLGAGTGNIAEFAAFNPLLNSAFSEPGHARTPVHTGDLTPNRLTTANGSVSGIQARLAKSSTVDAAEDIANIELVIQHVNNGDLSQISAGRDITFASARGGAGRILVNSDAEGALRADGDKIAVGGPGDTQVIAGRDINLGTSNGLRTFGDENNPVLADDGSNLLVLTGASGAPDWAAFLVRYLDSDSADADTIGQAAAALINERYSPANEVTVDDLELPTDSRQLYHADLVRYLQALDSAGVREYDAASDPVEQLRSLPLDRQINFLAAVFFNELQLSSLEAADIESDHYEDYVRGRHAIAVLFPGGDGDYQGNLTSALSAVQTLDGGNLRAFVPGGTVDAGTTAQTGVQKSPVDLGYVAYRAGDVEIYASASINVNSTRIFAQGGGDVSLWSDHGNIDAGRGVRDATTLASTEPVYNVFLDYLNLPPIAVAGSGIRTLAPAGVTPGGITLAAPEGTIDAGDAGIESGSTLVLAAKEVANADFIGAGGPTISSVQAPAAVGAGLGNLGDVSAAATSAVAETTRQAATQAAAQAAAAAAQPVAAPTRINVEVLDFGSG